MPIINVTVSAKPDAARSARIASEVTALTQHHLRKDPAVTAVVVHSVDPEHWFAGGRSLAEQRANSFWLDIKVVDGTNTKAEMAGYLEDVYAAMGRILGDVHAESYILVHEVPGSAYGFGGVTQEFRFIKGRIQNG